MGLANSATEWYSFTSSNVIKKIISNRVTKMTDVEEYHVLELPLVWTLFRVASRVLSTCLNSAGCPGLALRKIRLVKRPSDYPVIEFMTDEQISKLWTDDRIIKTINWRSKITALNKHSKHWIWLNEGKMYLRKHTQSNNNKSIHACPQCWKHALTTNTFLPQCLFDQPLIARLCLLLTFQNDPNVINESILV